MKRVLIIIIPIVLMMATASYAQQASSTCSGATAVFDEFGNTLDYPKYLRDALMNYAATSPHRICGWLDTQDPISVDLSQSAIISKLGASFNGFILNTTDDSDVYIVNIELSAQNALTYNDPSDNPDLGQVKYPILTINHNKSGTVKLENITITGTRNPAILVKGTGKVELRNVVVTGDASNSEDCIVLQSKDALLDGVTVSGCKVGLSVQSEDTRIQNANISRSIDGIYIRANNATVEDSEIYNNHVGINIEKGFLKTKVRHSLIHSNFSGVDRGDARFDAILFNDDIFNDLSLRPDGDLDKYNAADDVVEFGGGVAKVQLPKENTTEGEFEIFKASPVNGQAIGYAMGPVSFDSSSFDKDGKMNVDLDSSLYSEKLVVLYTDENSGSTPLSKKFKLIDTGGGASPIVTFIQTPVDIIADPNDVRDDGGGGGGGGGSLDDELYVDTRNDEVEEKTGSNSSRMEGGATIESGTQTVQTGPRLAFDGRCSLIAAANIDAAMMGIAWLIIVLAISFGSLAAVRIRVNRKQKR